MSSSLNDITVLDRSPSFAELTRGRAPTANYTINNHAYTIGYYLADDIYPRWATIVKTISQPQGAKRQLFARMQEACRKDAERAFGVLQAQFNIVSVPARGWSDEDLYYIMKTCIILHNMIIEDERNIPENERSAVQLETDTTRFPTHRLFTLSSDTALTNNWIVTNTWTVVVFKRNAVFHRGIRG
ncbi:uncharacterized protein LOC114309433 [Camellia sinensis]|uniref:uncharacterized protein LOC114309433 n=1 Tax=Camellia sinensis TaxID=4442 RepID=UPI0010363D7A|nr:uncharacterized protein LOC114309433 [Camellia sinensis]